MLLIFAICLPACRGKTTNTPVIPPVTLTFACNADEMALYREAAEIFHQDYPTIQVHVVSLDEIVSFPLDETDLLGPVEKLAAVADVFAWTDDGVEGGPAGMILDLAPFAQSDAGLAEEAFLPGLLAHFQWQGATWAIPAWVGGRVMVYDPAAFDSAGLAHPAPGWTWGDFLYAVSKLTQREGEQIARYGAYLDVQSARSVVDAQGAALIDDAREVVVPTLDDPYVAQAVQWYVDLALVDEVVRIPTGTERVDPLEMLEHGQVAMAVLTTGLLSADLAMQGWQIAPLPGSSRVYPYGYYISAGTAYAQAAWQWVQFLSHEVVSLKGLPARSSMLAESPFARIAGAQAFEAIEYTVAHALLPVRPLLVERLLHRAVERALNGEPVASALAQTQQWALNPPDPGEYESVAVPTAVSVSKQDVERITFVVNLPQLGQYKALADLFHGLHPDIQVVVRAAPDVEGYTSSMADDLPALLQVSGADCVFWTAGMSGSAEAQQAVMDLNPFLDRDEAFPLDDYVAHALDSVNIDGRMLGLPAGVTVNVLYYNRALFDEAGVAYPDREWTWDDLFLAAHQLVRGDDDERQYGFLIWPLGASIIPLIESMGSTLVEQTGGGAVFRFNDPDVISDIKKLKALVQDDVIPCVTPQILDDPRSGQKRTSYNLSPLARLAETGRAGMWIERVGGQFVNPGPDVYPARLPASYRSGFQLSAAYHIAAGTPHAEACWAWLKFLSEQIPPDRSLPPRRSLLALEAFGQAVGAEAQAVYLAILSDVNSEVSVWDILPPGYAWARMWMMEALEAILWQDADIQEALNKAQFNADAYVDCLRRHPDQADKKAAEACVWEIDPETAALYGFSPAGP